MKTCAPPVIITMALWQLYIWAHDARLRIAGTSERVLKECSTS